MKVKDLIALLKRYNLEEQVIVRLNLLDGEEVHDFPINETYGLTNRVVLEIIERDSTRNYRRDKEFWEENEK